MIAAELLRYGAMALVAAVAFVAYRKQRSLLPVAVALVFVVWPLVVQPLWAAGFREALDADGRRSIGEQVRFYSAVGLFARALLVALLAYGVILLRRDIEGRRR